MLQKDQPEVSVAVLIEASPEKVWQFVSDITTPTHFSDEFKAAQWINGATGPSVGAHFEGTNGRGETQWTTTCIVTQYEEQKVFEYCVESVEVPVATWRYSVQPQGEQVELTYWAKMGLAPNGMTAHYKGDPEREARIIANRMEMWRTNMQATIDGIKALAEDPAA